MITIQKKDLLSGRPVFSDIPSTNTVSKLFDKENSLLDPLRPSYKKALTITLLCKKIINWIATFFVPLRPNVWKDKLPFLIRAGSYNESPTQISFGNLCAHYKRFLQADSKCSPQLKGCLERLEKDENTLLSLNQKKRSTQPEKFQKEYGLFIQKNLNEILQMKAGSSRLLLLNRSPKVDNTVGGAFILYNQQIARK